ncbi:heavy metal-binding domain-containing protein [Sphingobacterium faecium]|uniref:heavy metal-binding domain-containing protein n=1 Tax=Sphingobacterium faecium TaxID=34087 RepID=UPI001D17A110|nr:heavy metal-binding domain-containing protein [Sphingobacterium faecium]
MIVTSTNTIEGREVLRYFDPISATAVIGANALSEIGASFVDFFGGRSRNYENKLQELYKSVVESLKQNARSYRADAVVGFSVNIDEISGKGTQMFMITAIGTPVLLNEIKHIQAEAVGEDIDGSVIKNKVKASLIIERYTGIYTMDNATAEFIATSRLTEFVPLLFKAMNEAGEDQEFKDRQATLFRYFDFLDKDQAIAILYGQLLSGDLTRAQFKIISKAISSSNLIDYDQVAKLLAGSLLAKKAALKVLTLDKDWYSAQDIAYLQTLKGEGLVQLFPEVVTVKESKDSITFSTPKNELDLELQ